MDYGYYMHFNSRAHAGHDHYVVFLDDRPEVNFNSRAHAGHDVERQTFVSAVNNFNSRAHAGHDSFCFSSLNLLRNFNSRAHAGHDPARQQLNSHL